MMPEPPYHAVIFASTRTGEDDGCAAMAARMVDLAAQRLGREKWDSEYSHSVARVERATEWRSG